MGFCEALTLAFIILKLMNVISWSWFVVFIPMYLAIVLYVLIITVTIITLRRK